jgi:hypothetical protein
MTTSKEFIKGGVTGQTFREITEKFGKPFRTLGEADAVMSVYALGFAWFREREHLPVPAAYDKAMSWSIDQIEALFEESDDAEVEADFVSPPPTTTP